MFPITAGLKCLHVIGELETHDPLCRDLCIKSGRVIVSVDYRLAPENPFPCAPNDCFAALKWVVDNTESLNGIKNEIVVAGDSSGGQPGSGHGDTGER